MRGAVSVGGRPGACPLYTMSVRGGRRPLLGCLAGAAARLVAGGRAGGAAAGGGRSRRRCSPLGGRRPLLRWRTESKVSGKHNRPASAQYNNYGQ